MTTNEPTRPDDERTPAAEDDQPRTPEPDAQRHEVSPRGIGQAGKRYVVFEPETGRIIGTYGVLDARTGEYREQSEHDIRSAFQGAPAARGPGTAEAAALGVLELDARQVAGSAMIGNRVDPAENRLVPQPRLRLSADRQEITGDGEDSTELTVTLVGSDDAPDETFDGEVRVSTTHGRLSAPGGRLRMSHGTATITLTSTPETIEQVVVSARDPRGLAVAGNIAIEFL